MDVKMIFKMKSNRAIDRRRIYLSRNYLTYLIASAQKARTFWQKPVKDE